MYLENDFSTKIIIAILLIGVFAIHHGVVSGEKLQKEHETNETDRRHHPDDNNNDSDEYSSHLRRKLHIPHWSIAASGTTVLVSTVIILPAVILSYKYYKSRPIAAGIQPSKPDESDKLLQEPTDDDIIDDSGILPDIPNIPNIPEIPDSLP